MLLLAEVAATSQAVASTRSRRAKASHLAELLRGARPQEASLAVGFLIGEPRQGRIGVGWSTLDRLDVAPAAEPSLTVLEVDGVLDRIWATTGPGSQARRAALLGELWGRATSGEQAFLVRLLLGELRQGALEGVMVEAIAAASEVPVAEVRRAAMVVGDVRTVAGLAVDGGVEALRAVGLQVGRGLLPMLATTAADVAEALARTGRASVEWKLDGVRIQVHKAGDDVRVFTRNLNDATARSGELVTVIRRLAVHRVVLDGEAVGLDESGRPHAFQDSMSRFSSGPGDALVPADEATQEGAGVGVEAEAGMALRPFFFDVLHVEGEDLLDAPLVGRQAILDAILPAELVVPRLVTDDPGAAAAFLEDTVRAGHEGVVVKSLTAGYDAGRRGSHWQKVKPVHTFDLVVLAAEWGHGRRRGWLSNLHLGARDPATGGFVMLGKTFKGLTDEVLAWQTERLLELEAGSSPGTVHVRPELVVEVALDGVQRSTRYPGGVALRFARVKRYRPDKSPTEADTVDAVRALLTSS